MFRVSIGFVRHVRSRSNFTRRLNCTRGYSDISGRIRGWSAAARNVTDSSAANCIGITLGTPGKTGFDLRLSLLLAIGPRGGGGDGGGGGGGEGKEAAGGKERWMEEEARGDERKGERGSYESFERGRSGAMGREGSQLILRWQTVRLSQRRFCSSPK